MLRKVIVLQSTKTGVLPAFMLALATWLGCGGDDSACLELRAASEIGSACTGGTGGSAGAGGSAGSGGTGGSGMPVMVNGCGASMAIDKRSDAITTITFAGIEYTPRCVRVGEGAMVVFSGDFASHPLVGGTVNGSTGTPDNASPLQPMSSGSELHVSLSKVGSVPYYCTAHVGSGMMGAIFVE
jgi:plastocyanin